MEFNIAYNCHCSLRLETGREISLDKLTQSRVYAGLLEGTPNKKSNDLAIQWILKRTSKDNELVGEPFLIDPERRDYLRTPGDMQSVLNSQGNRPPEMRHIPEWLPQIACVGVFSSLRPARDITKNASSLTIVWYQDDFGLNPQAIERLRLVDWNEHAIDCDN